MGSQPKPFSKEQAKAKAKAEDHNTVPQPHILVDWQCAATGLLEKMESVVSDIKSYDADEPPATCYARQRIRTVIEATAKWTKIPMGSVVPLDGGIQISWRAGNRHVRLFCAQDNSHRSYLYKAIGSGNSRKSELLDANAVTLAQHLRWLHQQ